jgi:hypothetical protein
MSDYERFKKMLRDCAVNYAIGYYSGYDYIHVYDTNYMFVKETGKLAKVYNSRNK